MPQREDNRKNLEFAKWKNNETGGERNVNSDFKMIKDLLQTMGIGKKNNKRVVLSQFPQIHVSN